MANPTSILSRLLYAAAVIILGVSIAVFVSSLPPENVTYFHRVDSTQFQHITMPGRTDLRAKSPGLYSLFYVTGKRSPAPSWYRYEKNGNQLIITSEYVAQSDGGENRSYLAPVLPAMACQLGERSSGQTLEPLRSTSELTPNLHESDGTEGTLGLQYQIIRPGIYKYSCTYEHGGKGPQFRLAWIDDYRNRALDKYPGDYFLGLIVLLAGIALSSAIAVYTFMETRVRRPSF